MTTGLKIETNGAVLELTLDRPKANAIDAATSIALGDAFASFRDDPALRVAIITGAGDRIFSAGADLKAAAERGESETTYQGVGGFAGLTELFDVDKPVIAAVNGVAAGGGFELVLACDLIVAADSAAFMLPESRVGVVADAGGVQRLPRRLPYFIAMDLLLTGRRMPAAEAAHFGLVNYVVPQAEVMLKARELAQLILEAAPLSVRAVKEMLRHTERMSVEEAMRATRARQFPAHVRALESEDHIEGPRAFAEKRKPVWKNR
jgi:crotonobetainyl-CoA hydratase